LSSVSPRPSYRDVPPLESGGVTARIGFDFQDHVAAGYCIDMLQNENLLEVWCESLDDVTLIRSNKGLEEFEFVQVKSNEFDHLWSVAELCKRDKKNGRWKVGSSILEKSLAYERGSEPCCFRMVTCLGVKKELEDLTLPLSSPSRSSPSENFTKLCALISERISDYQSENGSDASSWLSRVVWEVCHSTEALENANLRKLMKSVHSLSFFLVEDQLNEMYSKILQRVQDAGIARWEVDPEAKKLKQSEFLSWVKDLAHKAQHPGVIGKGGQLSRKMQSAEIPSDSITNAQELRMFYRGCSLSSGYMDLSRRKEIEMNTQAHLHQLVSQLDAGKILDTGIEFHSRCLDLLSEVHPDTEEVTLSFLQGFMYSLADRCVL
jgi:hypothetical protein